MTYVHGNELGKDWINAKGVGTRGGHCDRVSVSTSWQSPDDSGRGYGGTEIQATFLLKTEIVKLFRLMMFR